jgi:putative transposase
MIYNPDKHHRRTIRLKGYDYSQAGVYFVTICTQNRDCLFGDVTSGEMQKNSAGEMIQKVRNELPLKYSDVAIDEFIVMPNHIHGIIILLVGAGPCACPLSPCAIRQPEGNRLNPEEGQPQGVAPPARLILPDVVHRFKSFTTSQYRMNVTLNNWPPFPGKLWQRNYYEHIIRNENELNRIREYIINNPVQWPEDENNPVNVNQRLTSPTLRHNN